MAVVSGMEWLTPPTEVGGGRKWRTHYHGGRLQPVRMRPPPPPPPPQLSVKTWGELGGGPLEGMGGEGRLEGVWGGVRPWGGGVPKVGGSTRDPLLPHAYLQGGCVSGVGLGKLLVAVVKQGLQMGRCVHSGCGDLSLCNERRLFSASSF